MPTYSYVCDACSHRFDVMHSITADALTTCPECGEDKLRRLIVGGAGLIFKGSGFYINDYARNKGGDSEGKEKAKSKDDQQKKAPKTGQDKKDSKSAKETQ